MSRTRADGYFNAVIGHGNKNRDPTEHWGFSLSGLLSDQLLSDLYVGNGLARRIINIPANEAVKNWVNVDIKDEIAGKQMLKMLDNLDSEANFAEALRWARLYGGSLMLMLADDGGTLQEPLDESSIKRIEDLRVYDRTEVTWNYADLYDDPADTKYGTPEFYEITPVNGNSFRVHESRVFTFKGEPLPHRYNAFFQNWGMPVFQGITDDIKNCIVGHKNASLLLERLSQAIYKMPDLGALLETEQGEEMVMKRLNLIDMARSLLNTIAIDGSEEFSLVNIPVSQVPNLLDQFGIMVSTVSGIPYTLLFGRSPAGMDATGESDLENYYNMVRQIQKNQLKKPLIRLLKLLLLCQDGPFKGNDPGDWEIEFLPLWLPSDKEKAEAEKESNEALKLESETAKNYVDMGALDPSEVRKKLSQEGKYEIDESLDDLKEMENG